MIVYVWTEMAACCFLLLLSLLYYVRPESPKRYQDS